MAASHTFPTIIPSLLKFPKSERAMKTKNIYNQPICVTMTLDLEKLFCASFDSKDNTENWHIEDEETI